MALRVLLIAFFGLQTSALKIALKIQGDHDSEFAKIQRAGPIIMTGLPPLEQNQEGHATHDNRYPDIFAKIESMYKEDPTKKLLSFGCSHGNEVRTLRKYLPLSTVHGIDVDAGIIAGNKKGNTDKNVEYFSDANEVEGKSYDMVLAMSVLCHSPDPPIHFEVFNRTVELIDKLVAKGGYMVMYNTNYKFTDTEVSKRYDNVGEHDKSFQFRSGDGTPLYDKDVDVAHICDQPGRCTKLPAQKIYDPWKDRGWLREHYNNETRKDHPFVFFQKKY